MMKNSDDLALAHLIEVMRDRRYPVGRRQGRLVFNGGDATGRADRLDGPAREVDNILGVFTPKHASYNHYCLYAVKRIFSEQLANADLQSDRVRIAEVVQDIFNKRPQFASSVRKDDIEQLRGELLRYSKLTTGDKEFPPVERLGFRTDDRDGAVGVPTGRRRDWENCRQHVRQLLNRMVPDGGYFDRYRQELIDSSLAYASAGELTGKLQNWQSELDAVGHVWRLPAGAAVEIGNLIETQLENEMSAASERQPTKRLRLSSPERPAIAPTPRYLPDVITQAVRRDPPPTPSANLGATRLAEEIAGSIDEIVPREKGNLAWQLRFVKIVSAKRVTLAKPGGAAAVFSKSSRRRDQRLLGNHAKAIEALAGAVAEYHKAWMLPQREEAVPSRVAAPVATADSATRQADTRPLNSGTAGLPSHQEISRAGLKRQRDESGAPAHSGESGESEPARRHESSRPPSSDDESELEYAPIVYSVEGPVTQPPARRPRYSDLGLYSHDFRLSKGYYTMILRKMGLSDNLYYESAEDGARKHKFPAERFDRLATPEQWPFMAEDDNYHFSSGDWKLLEGSGVCIQTDRDDQDGRRIYVELNKHQFSKMANHEKTVLGLRQANMTLSEFPQNNSASLEAARRTIKSIFLRVDLPSGLADRVRSDLPLLAFRTSRMFSDDKDRVFLPSRGHECLVTNYEEFAQPTYIRLDTHQSKQLTEQERKYLGLVPTWAQRAPLNVQRELGLLPPPREDDYWEKPDLYRSGWRPRNTAVVQQESTAGRSGERTEPSRSGDIATSRGLNQRERSGRDTP
jgi:hypothetical protein